MCPNGLRRLIRMRTMWKVDGSNPVEGIYFDLIFAPSPFLELKWLFNVTINDISVIYVTAHRCAGGLKKKLDLRSGSQRHRHFAGFFNVPVLAPTQDHPFYTVIPRHTAPFSRLLRSRWGYGGHILDLTPQALMGVPFLTSRRNTYK